MNCKPFDRNTVERQLHNGLTLDGFISKYEFDNEEEFRNQLIRVFSEPAKVDKIIRELKKKAKKNPKNQKKSPQEIGEDEAVNKFNPMFVPVQDTMLTVPYNTMHINSMIDEIKENSNIKVTEHDGSCCEQLGIDFAPEIQVSSTESEIDILKVKLADTQKYLSEIDVEIAECEKKHSEAMKAIVNSKQKLEELYEHIAKEKEKVQAEIENLEIYNGKIKENKQLREITVEEIAGLEKQIKNLEVKTLYFGENFKDEYHYNASNFEITQDSITQKMTQLFVMGTYEDFAVSKLRKLANVLCTIDMVVKENDNIEILFEAEDSEFVDAVKGTTQYVVKVM